jgi:uncharacterized protein involved in exopolysaccharide biosynthesis
MKNLGVNYFLEVFFRRKKTLVEVAAIVFGIAILGTALWPASYKSTAEILVQDNRAELLVSPDIQSGMTKDATVIANPVSQEDLNSELELLTNPQLIRAAIKDAPTEERYGGPGAFVVQAMMTMLSLPQIAYNALHEAVPMTDRDRWLLKIRRHLNPQVIKRSNVIEITYSSHDAQWSRELLSRLLNQYLEYHARISHDPQAEIFFQRQAQQLNGQLHASEESLRAFQLQSGITSLPDQNQALVDQLSELQLDYEKAGVQLVSANQQVSSLEAMLKTKPERIEKESKSVQNIALAQLKPQVMQLKAERAQLLSRYQPDSLMIRQIDAKVAEAQKVIDHEDKLEVQERSTDLNPVWVTVDSNLATAKTSAETLQAGQKDLAARIAQIQQRIAQMVNIGVELGRLQRQVQIDSDAYLTYIRKTEEARVAQGLNTSKILNVSVSQPPDFPLKPAFPIVWLNLLVGVILAIGLGMGAAYREELGDPRLYSSAAIAEVSGLTTVAKLSEQV